MTDAAQDAARETGRQARRAADSRWFETTARAGFVGSGVVHLLIGYLAVLLGVGNASAGSGAQGSESGDTDQSGALAQLASVPGGVVLLWLVAVGTAALAIRLLVEAVVGGRTDDARAWVNRGEERRQGRGLRRHHLLVRQLRGRRREELLRVDDERRRDRARDAGRCRTPARRRRGRDRHRGGTRRDRGAGGPGRSTSGPSRNPSVDRWPCSRPSGTSPRGVAVVIVGVLVAVAAFRSDPEQASGLDGAFDALRSMPGGSVVLVVVGLGFAAFGVYSFFRARYARI
ncbi:DUF1206 domain-containing protein [Curtobacterium sp. MCJR17_043]|nr:DUF1206 domain-containing protein [Curtobacterium sp. MCJR17_043]WIB36292.1 DUF1206 domain-containing protein [Curtobacterium sp. MCJR17_043]